MLKIKEEEEGNCRDDAR